MKTLSVAALMSLSLVGCVSQESDVTNSFEAICTPGYPGCPRLPRAGEEGQGRELSGDVFPEGMSVSPVSVTVNGVNATAAAVLGGTLYAKINNDWISGDQLKGAIMTAAAPGVSPVKLHITEVVNAQNDPDQDSFLMNVDPSGSTLLYTVNYFDANGQEQPLCNVDTSWDTVTQRYHNSPRALVMPVWYDAKGRQNLGAYPAKMSTPASASSAKGFAFACMSGVSAKCYKWGYMPWLQPDPAHPQQMLAAHWTCTRAARADYCGDGTTHTYDNTPVKIFDNVQPTHIRNDDPGQIIVVDPLPTRGVATAGITKVKFPAPLPFEAGWSTAGATCLSHARWNSMPNNVCPERNQPFEIISDIDSVDFKMVCDNEAQAEALAVNYNQPTPVVFNRSDINAVLMPWVPPGNIGNVGNIGSVAVAK